MQKNHYSTSTDHKGIVCVKTKYAYIFRLQLATLPDLILISVQNGIEYIFSFKRLLNV